MYYRVAFDDRMIKRRFWRKPDAIVFAKSAIAREGVTVATIYSYRRYGDLYGDLFGHFELTRANLEDEETR